MLPSFAGARHERLELLDLYRGICVLLVMAFHYTTRLPAGTLPGADGGGAVPFGYVGVYAFFAISGFCISLTIERAATLGHFFAKRIARIYPAFVICSLATKFVVDHWGTDAQHRSWAEWAGNMVFLMDLGVRPIDGVYWTLVVEMKYYLLYALVHFGLGARLALFGLIGLTASALVLSHLGRDGGMPWIRRVADIVLLAPHLPWFLLGAAYYERYRGRAGVAPILVAAVLAAWVALWLGIARQAELLVVAAIIAGFEALLRHREITLPPTAKEGLHNPPGNCGCAVAGELRRCRS